MLFRSISLGDTTNQTYGTVGLLDGNAAANRTVISNTINSLSIIPGTTIWIRLNDFDVTNSDDGLAVDDFSMTMYTYAWTGPSFTASTEDISNLAAGTYNVTITGAKGCTASGSATVTTTTPPAQPTITGSPTTFCAGGSVLLTATAASGYQWYLNGSPISGATNQTYSATASGNYTVTITGANGCVSIQSAATAVTVNPLPTVSSVTGGNTYCAGATVANIVANVTGSGLWSVAFTLNSIAQTPATGASSPITLGLIKRL